jgi:hypothetical protein
VMYHSAGLDTLPWVWKHISLPEEQLRRQLEALGRARYEPLFLDEALAVSEGTRRCRKPLLITFDDGYLDNWTVIYPMLEEFGLKATVFVNPEFVDPSTEVRPTLADAQRGRLPEADVPRAGFLSWPELRAMQASGRFDIQSHTMTHTWHFSGPPVVDFHAPGGTTGYPWLAWNEAPARKHAYLTEDQDELVPWGRPIYAHQRALAGRRYLEDESLRRHLEALVSAEGGRRFFAAPGWQDRLREAVNEHRRDHGDAGRMETPSEWEARARFELGESRRILEERLDKPVRFVCWPGGGLTAEVVRWAAEAGYVAGTLPSKLGGAPPKDDLGFRWIPRVGAQSRIRLGDRDLGAAPARRLLRTLAVQGGDPWARAVHRTCSRLETLHALLRERARRVPGRRP